MLTHHKSSSSHSCSNKNKENLPINKETLPLQISFKKLSEIRNKKTFECSYLNEDFTGTEIKQKLRPCNVKEEINLREQAINFRGVDEVYDSSRRNTEKSTDGERSLQRSNNKEIESLLYQVSTLNSTVSLLNEQISFFEFENKQLLSENQEQKQIIQEKSEVIEKLKFPQKRSVSPTSHPPKPNECIKCRKDKQAKLDYDEVIEKLNELEEIQNGLVEENESLKKKEKMNKGMLKNLEILIKGGRYEEVCDILILLHD